MEGDAAAKSTDGPPAIDETESSFSIDHTTQSAGDFIQSMMTEGEVFRTRQTSGIHTSFHDSFLNLPDESETPVLDIMNCVGPIEDASVYIKGELRDTRQPSQEKSKGGFCGVDLRKLKLQAEMVQKEVTESSSNYESFAEADDVQWVGSGENRSMKDPDFRYRDSPSLVLLILRKDTPNVLDCALRRIAHLRDLRGVNVLLEPNVREKVEALMNSGEALNALKEPFHKLHQVIDMDNFLTMKGIVTWKDDYQLPKLTPWINFGIVLGGDGTVLWTSLLFPKRVPPLLCVAMGSLGYLANTKPQECQARVEDLIDGKRFKADLRCRLEAYLTDPDETPVRVKDFKSQTGTMHYETKGVGRAEDDVLFMTVLNDIVISKASYGQLCTLDCFMNGEYFTTCSADGLIIATPTGSTAYSMSAGGSIVHPGVPAMMFTPICPHSLSFRPLVLPDNVVLSIKNPVDNRTPKPMIISRDGFGGDELKLPPGYTVHIRVSTHPVPLITMYSPYESKQSGGKWLTSLNDRLKWNYRKRQNGRGL